MSSSARVPWPHAVLRAPLQRLLRSVGTISTLPWVSPAGALSGADTAAAHREDLSPRPAEEQRGERQVWRSSQDGAGEV